VTISKSAIRAGLGGSRPLAGSGILDHRRFDNLWHDFHLQVSVLPEARAAVTDLGAKLRNHLPMPAEISETHTYNAKVVAK
jgi:epsilon-lactone hydrolase